MVLRSFSQLIFDAKKLVVFRNTVRKAHHRRNRSWPRNDRNAERRHRYILLLLALAMLSMMKRLNMGLLCIQQVVGNSEYKYAAGNSQRMDVDVKKPEDKLSEYEKRDQDQKR